MQTSLENLEIVNYDPQYVEQHQKIRNTVAKTLPFSSTELGLELEEMKQLYGSETYGTCNVLKYALIGDQLVGFVTCAIHNSILQNISIDQMENSAHIDYPMVKEGYESVISHLIRAITNDIADRGIEMIYCDISKDHQNSQEVIGELFDLERARIRFGEVVLGTEVDLPKPVNVRPSTDDDKTKVRSKILETIPVPEEILDDMLSNVFRVDLPRIVKENESGEIIGWLAVVSSEEDSSVVEVQIPYIRNDDEEEYQQIGLELLHAIISAASDYPDLKKLRIAPMFKPTLLDYLEEKGINFDLVMGSYRIKPEVIAKEYN